VSAREPAAAKNLDGYGSAPLEWSRARDLLAAQGGASVDNPYFISTIGPDGPHTNGIGAIWFEDDLWFVTGPGTRRGRNLAADPRCTVNVRLPGLDLVLEGTAERVTDRATLERVVARYRASGWPAEVSGDAFTAPYSAPSAGPPPWYLYRLVTRAAHAVASAEPHGATRWTFA
jgi:hypothetical protein